VSTPSKPPKSDQGRRFAPRVPFEEYKERFKEFFNLKRENGIIEVRAHTRGGEVQWSREVHEGWGRIFQFVGADPENEVMIITGTGEHWIAGMDKVTMASMVEKAEANPKAFAEDTYDGWYVDGSRLLDALLWDIPIPTIGAINGPGMHTEFPLLCDLTICTADTQFFEAHMPIGVAPGDGQFLVWQQLLGLKKANYFMLTGEPIDAKSALEWGLVNGVVPREELIPRAWELAEVMMKQPRVVRRLTSQLMKRPWRRLFTEDFNMHFAHECFAVNVTGMGRANPGPSSKKD